MPNWLILEEAAECLKMGQDMLYDFACKAKGPTHRMGQMWRCDAAILDEWLKT